MSSDIVNETGRSVTLFRVAGEVLGTRSDNYALKHVFYYAVDRASALKAQRVIAHIRIAQ